MLGEALFSPCLKYRYTLYRSIVPVDIYESISKTSVAFLMLNPSTADEYTNDPTIAKCSTYARLWGYSELVVVNLFAYRSTDPKVLTKVEDPIGPDNDAVIIEIAKSVDTVVCAWGRHGKVGDRGQIVTGMLRHEDIKLYCLELNQDGSPCHPLYKKLDLKPTHWSEADEYGCSIH